MNKPTEFCLNCPAATADVQPQIVDDTICEGPILAIDAVTVTGLRGKELRDGSDGERRICGREWTEPAEQNAYTIYSDKPEDGDTIAITTYGTSAERIRNMTPERQQRLVKQYLTEVRPNNTVSSRILPVVQPLVGLHSAQTDVERARNVSGFEADQQVANALAASTQLTTEVHRLLHDTLDRTKVEESVRALAMINTIVRCMPELHEADLAARNQLHHFLGEIGIHGLTSMQYQQYLRTTEKHRAPFEPYVVSDEPTILALKQRLFAAARMLGGGQLECAHIIALKRADITSQLLAETQHADGLKAAALMRAVPDQILEYKEKVSDLSMHLSLVRAQY